MGNHDLHERSQAFPDDGTRRCDEPRCIPGPVERVLAATFGDGDIVITKNCPIFSNRPEKRQAAYFTLSYLGTDPNALGRKTFQLFRRSRYDPVRTD
ncbi:hypothetical protein ATY81_26920 [Rhizobium sp. R72]|nr:hypothetical protein ATY81_26920 [Rhizobium sp. R72]OWV98695.1 hypothetical protein ATY80_26920 [Rhizobium sp. R711]